MAFEPDLFFKEGLVVPGPSPGSRQDRRTVFVSGSRRLRAPFYWDPSEEDVSEDVTVWLWEPEEDVVDDETLPFA